MRSLYHAMLLRARGHGLAWLTFAVLALFVAAYLVIALARIPYAYDLDFLESPQLTEAWQIAHGLPVFARPNADFVPLVYTPFYMWLSAGLLDLFGVGYAPLRLLSFAATLMTAGLLLWAGFFVSKRWSIVLVGPGLWFAGYALTGTQYELARIDTAFVALCMAGTLLGIVGAESRRRVMLSALLLALAFLTKQAALMAAVGMAFYLLVFHRKQIWTFALVFALVGVVPLLLMDRLTGGWSTYYMFDVPASEPAIMSRLVAFVRRDLLESFGPLCFAAAALALNILRRHGRSTVHPLVRGWLFFTLLALIDSGLQRARSGGNLNTLMHAYAFLCLIPVLLLNEFASSTAESSSGWLSNMVYLVVLWQCVIGSYNPLTEMPSAAMTQSGQRLVDRIAQFDGPVLVLEQPSYALLAGKAPGVALTPLWHVRKQGRLPLPVDLVQRIRQKAYAAIITDDGEYFEVEAELRSLINEAYTLGAPLTEQDAPPTLSGVVVRPAQVYVRKP